MKLKDLINTDFIEQVSLVKGNNGEIYTHFRLETNMNSIFESNLHKVKYVLGSFDGSILEFDIEEEITVNNNLVCIKDINGSQFKLLFYKLTPINFKTNS